MNVYSLIPIVLSLFLAAVGASCMYCFIELAFKSDRSPEEVERAAEHVAVAAFCFVSAITVPLVILIK